MITINNAINIQFYILKYFANMLQEQIKINCFNSINILLKFILILNKKKKGIPNNKYSNNSTQIGDLQFLIIINQKKNSTKK